MLKLALPLAAAAGGAASVVLLAGLPPGPAAPAPVAAPRVASEAAPAPPLLPVAYRATPGACGPASVPDDPRATAERFLETVVSRTDPRGGFRLTTDDLRQGTTCLDWVRGRIPVVAYRGIDWTRSNYRVVVVGDGQVVLRVVLYGSNTAPAAFLLELRRARGATEWRVGTWMPVKLQSSDRRLPAEAQQPAAPVS